jgi:hypothetical protein
MKTREENWCGEGDLFVRTTLKIGKLYTSRRRQSTKSATNTPSSHTTSHTVCARKHIIRVKRCCIRCLAPVAAAHKGLAARPNCCADGNRTCLTPVQSSSVGSKSFILRSVGIANLAQSVPQVSDVAARWPRAP